MKLLNFIFLLLVSSIIFGCNREETSLVKDTNSVSNIETVDTPIDNDLTELEGAFDEVNDTELNGVGNDLEIFNYI